VRVSGAFSLLLRLPGVWVRDVCFGPDRVIVLVALRRRLLICPDCAYSTQYRESEQAHDSWWRHLDLGVWRLEVRCQLRRLRCPEHGVRVEAVPFARSGARFTRHLRLCPESRKNLHPHRRYRLSASTPDSTHATCDTLPHFSLRRG
jgi:transposase